MLCTQHVFKSCNRQKALSQDESSSITSWQRHIFVSASSKECTHRAESNKGASPRFLQSPSDVTIIRVTILVLACHESWSKYFKMCPRSIIALTRNLLTSLLTGLWSTSIIRSIACKRHVLASLLMGLESSLVTGSIALTGNMLARLLFDLEVFRKSRATWRSSISCKRVQAVHIAHTHRRHKLDDTYMANFSLHWCSISLLLPNSTAFSSYLHHTVKKYLHHTVKNQFPLKEIGHVLPRIITGNRTCLAQRYWHVLLTGKVIEDPEEHLLICLCETIVGISRSSKQSTWLRVCSLKGDRHPLNREPCTK